MRGLWCWLQLSPSGGEPQQLLAAHWFVASAGTCCQPW
jgi:hypothetical protein